MKIGSISAEVVAKVTRLLIGGLLFLCMFSMQGMDTRIAHQYLMIAGIMIVFSLYLKNIWITLFMWLTIALWAFFRLEIGFNYVLNVFFGCVLYLMVKTSFRRQQVSWFINMVLWLVVFNLFYMILQVIGFDFVYKMGNYNIEGLTGYFDNNEPTGFMGFKAGMGCLMAIGVPLLWTREGRVAKVGSISLLWAIYISKSSVAICGAMVALLFIWFFRIQDKRLWIGTVIALILGGLAYVWYVDCPMGMMGTRIGMWKMALRDCIIHPFSGWGLDSFRKYTEYKQHLYVMNPVQNSVGIHVDHWDNPHNLYVSLFFEWGALGLFILGGYFRQLCIWFHKTSKTSNTLALFSACLVCLVVSIAQFPMFLARMAVIIIPLFALTELEIQ